MIYFILLPILISFNSCFDNHENVYYYNLMLYIAADNDLFNNADFSLTTSSIAIKERSPYFHMTAFCDGRYKKYSSKDASAHYFKIDDDGVRLVENIGLVNSGSLETFKNYVDFAKTVANSTILIFWGHGSGVASDGKGIGFMVDETAEKRGLPNYSMSFDDLVESVKYAKEAHGKKLDLVGFDACSMMHLEIIYELVDYANYVAASQTKANGVSWNYDHIIKWLNNNHGASFNQFLKWLNISFINFYKYIVKEFNINNPKKLARLNDTFSIVKTEKVKIFVNKFIAFISSLNLNNNQKIDFLNQVLRPSRVDSACQNVIDVKTFLNQTAIFLVNIDSNKSVAELIDLLDEIVFSSFSRIDSNALSFNLSELNPGKQNLSDYVSYNWDKDKKWISFLLSIKNAIPLQYFN